MFTPMEKVVLGVLVENEGWLVTYIEFAKADPGLDNKNAIAVYVHRLRKLIKGKITTVRGFGYIYDRS